MFLVMLSNACFMYQPRVNSPLIELLEKANKQKKQPNKISPKELANMKKTYDAASTFTAMVNKTFNKRIAYKDFELMHEAIDYDFQSNQANNNRSRRCHSKHSISDEDSDDDKPPPPCKRQKPGFKSVVTACHNESDNDDNDNDHEDNDDDFDDANEDDDDDDDGDDND